MLTLQLHLHTVVIQVEVRLPGCLSVSLLPELLEELSDWVVLGDGEGDVALLTLLLPLHVSDLPEDDLHKNGTNYFFMIL